MSYTNCPVSCIWLSAITREPFRENLQGQLSHVASSHNRPGPSGISCAKRPARSGSVPFLVAPGTCPGCPAAISQLGHPGAPTAALWQTKAQRYCTVAAAPSPLAPPASTTHTVGTSVATGPVSVRYKHPVGMRRGGTCSPHTLPRSPQVPTREPQGPERYRRDARQVPGGTSTAGAPPSVPPKLPISFPLLSSPSPSLVLKTSSFPSRFVSPQFVSSRSFFAVTLAPREKRITLSFSSQATRLFSSLLPLVRRHPVEKPFSLVPTPFPPESTRRCPRNPIVRLGSSSPFSNLFSLIPSTLTILSLLNSLGTFLSGLRCRVDSLIAPSECPPATPANTLACFVLRLHSSLARLYLTSCPLPHSPSSHLASIHLVFDGNRQPLAV